MKQKIPFPRSPIPPFFWYRLKQNYRRFFSLFLCLLFFLWSNAQEIDKCHSVNKKAEALYYDALEQLHRGMRDDAYTLLIECIKLAPDYVEAYHELAKINYGQAVHTVPNIYNMKKKEQEYSLSMQYFNKVIENCPEYDDYSTYFYLGELYFNKADYLSAKSNYSIYLEKNVYNKADKITAQKRVEIIDEYFFLLKHPVSFEPKPVLEICSPKDEFLPLISPDGQYMFYTQKYMEKTKHSDIERFFENFMVGDRESPYTSIEDAFNNIRLMPSPFNQGENQGGVTITIDNNHLFITICRRVKASWIEGGSYENCDIYQSDFIDGRWTTPYNTGPNINGQFTRESQPSISSDGKTIYFTSIRKENTGFNENMPTCDIYFSTLNSDGKWNKAVNIGEIINTPGNEKAPFMHSDSKTLYFASDGLYGMGGYDIYFSKLSDDGTWSKPRNIGYPINNEMDNIGMIVSNFGNKAYFTSKDIKENGGLDIYSFVLPQEARPEKILFIKGNLEDDKGKALTEAKVELVSAKTRKITEGMVDQKTGRYAIAVRIDEDEDEEFLMTVKKKNFAFSSAYIKPAELPIEKPVEFAMEVKSIKVGQRIEIHDIHFETNSWVFDKASMMILDKFGEFLEENPNIKIEIHGHTDNIGDEDFNLELSEKRAKSVKNYLWIIGISDERIPKCTGHGESVPVATNDTEEGRAKNRRTEFVIIEK
ncbi:MAG: OmpA family protein [Bacteroidia bacterium]|nr:OmpA family protein [Bacteroidia bacterium]